MGIDALIAFKAKPDFHMESDWLPFGRTVSVGADKYRCPGATHEVECMPWRYYGHCYERGPWPEICAVLLALHSRLDVETVYYGGDSDETLPEFNMGDALEMCKHYAEVGQRPYDAGWDAAVRRKNPYQTKEHNYEPNR